MKRLIIPLATATLAVFSPALASAQSGAAQGVVSETLVRVETPDGPRWLRLGEGVEIVDVTEGQAVRFNYEADTIEAIEITPEGTPLEDSGETAAQAIGERAPNVDGSTGSAGDAAAPGQATISEIIVRIDTPNGPRWYQLGQGVKAVDVTEGQAVRFSYEEDTIDAIVVAPDGAPASSGN